MYFFTIKKQINNCKTNTTIPEPTPETKIMTFTRAGG